MRWRARSAATHALGGHLYGGLVEDQMSVIRWLLNTSTQDRKTWERGELLIVVDSLFVAASSTKRLAWRHTCSKESATAGLNMFAINNSPMAGTTVTSIASPACRA